MRDKPLTDQQRALLAHFAKAQGHGGRTIPHQLRTAAQWAKRKGYLINLNRTSGIANTVGGVQWLHAITDAGRLALKKEAVREHVRGVFRRALPIIVDGAAWMILLGVWMVIYAILNPADAAEAQQVVLPVSAHLLKHVAMIGLLAIAGALVVVVALRKAKPVRATPRRRRPF